MDPSRFLTVTVYAKLLNTYFENMPSRKMLSPISTSPISPSTSKSKSPNSASAKPNFYETVMKFKANSAVTLQIGGSTITMDKQAVHRGFGVTPFAFSSSLKVRMYISRIIHSSHDLLFLAQIEDGAEDGWDTDMPVYTPPTPPTPQPASDKAWDSSLSWDSDEDEDVEPSSEPPVSSEPELPTDTPPTSELDPKEDSSGLEGPESPTSLEAPSESGDLEPPTLPEPVADDICDILIEAFRSQGIWSGKDLVFDFDDPLQFPWSPAYSDPPIDVSLESEESIDATSIPEPKLEEPIEEPAVEEVKSEEEEPTEELAEVEVVSKAGEPIEEQAGAGAESKDEEPPTKEQAKRVSKKKKERKKKKKSPPLANGLSSEDKASFDSFMERRSAGKAVEVRFNGKSLFMDGQSVHRGFGVTPFASSVLKVRHHVS